MTSSRPVLSNRSARHVFLDRHGLGRTPPRALPDIIDSLGFVQVDSIATVERAHHMILSARSKSYRPRHLTPLLQRDRTLFEHWTHDASIIPTRFFPYWKMRFARDARILRARWKNWRRDGYEQKFAAVLERIRETGSCGSRDVGEDEARTSGGWWDWHPSKTALEFLWRTGKLSICRREGFQKVYDLTERVIPAEYRNAEPTEAETVAWACNAALDRLGFATSGEIAKFWDAVTPAEAKAWCADQPDLIEVDIEGADGALRSVFARPDLLSDAGATAPPPSGVRVLSPFDPALRDRKRAERLFGFAYRIEIFVPEPKRKYGYYVFPVLEGERLIGRIDMKRNGPGGPLNITAFWPEAGVAMGKGRLDRLDGELHRVARFSGSACVTYLDNWRRW